MAKLWRDFSSLVSSCGGSNWPTILALSFIVLVIIVLHFKLHGAHGVLSERLKIEDSFIRLLSNLDITSNDEESLKRLTESYLDHIVEFLQDQGIRECSTIVFRPSASGSNAPLETWVHDDRASVGEIRRTFSIPGNNSAPVCGIVEKTFANGEIQIGTVKRQGAEWLIVNQDKPPVPIERMTSKPAYQSKAAIAIKDESLNSIGVLCIYSSEKNSFNKPGIEIFLPGFAGRLAIAIQIKNRNTVGPV